MGLGSAFMGQIMTLLATRLQPDTPLKQRLFDWPGDISPAGASVPLRLAGALHALKLNGNPELAKVYPPHMPGDDALWTAVNGALSEHAGFIDRFLDSPPQTNEVRRAAVLIAAGHWLAARHNLPMVLSELGASAGLNLMWDRFALAVDGARLGPAHPVLTLSPEWHGTPPPAAQPLTVVDRAGVDLNPIDVRDPDQTLRLMSYLWPDQPHRTSLTRAAISAQPPAPDQADAIDWLEARLIPRPGALHMIWTTIAWQYFPPNAQARGRALIDAAGQKATSDTPLAWLSYEADGGAPGAALSLRVWPPDTGPETCLTLGRADFHGRWVDWRAP